MGVRFQKTSMAVHPPALPLMFLGICCFGLFGCSGSSSWWRPADSPPPAGQTAPDASWGFGSVFGGGSRLSAEQPMGAEPPGSAASGGGSLDSRLAMARLCERRGETEQAKRLYQAYLEKNPPHALPYHRLGVISSQEGRFAEAEKYFHSAGQLAPPSAELLCDVGYAYYLQHRLPEAEQTLRQALAQDPRHHATLNNLGLVLGAQGRFAESLAFFRQAGSEAEAYANLGYLLAMSGRLQEAEDAYLYALTLDGRLKAAAGALVQVAQRRQTHAMLAAQRGQIPPVAAPDGMLAGSQSGYPSATPIPPNVGREPTRPTVFISDVRRLPPVQATHSTAAHPYPVWQ